MLFCNALSAAVRSVISFAILAFTSSNAGVNESPIVTVVLSGSVALEVTFTLMWESSAAFTFTAFTRAFTCAVSRLSEVCLFEASVSMFDWSVVSACLRAVVSASMRSPNDVSASLRA